MKLVAILALVGAVCAVPVEDTAEVAKAKAEFQAAYDRAAAAAEAAPDFDLDGALSTYSGYLSTVNGKLSPFFTNSYPYGAFGLHAPVVAGAPLAYSGLHGFPGTPLAYSGLHGFPGAFGFPGAYGFPGVVGSPFVKVVKAE
ncbi:cuticle protein 2-like [Penaeus monodon]|uniref:cuticle protein 2-like n=1 Tax=Penaeus monodon TaxID=6687 RepID=UPI0018A7130F|nr:cuticle protein 2-like [Penaeus monodon]